MIRISLRAFLKISSAIMLFVAVTGCQTPAEKNIEDLNNLYSSASVTYDNCVNAASQTRNGQILSKSLWLNSDAPPLSYLTNNTLPTGNQLFSLEEYHKLIRPCRQQAIYNFSSIDPRYSSILSELFLQQDTAAIALLNRNATWSQANAFLVEKHREFADRWINLTSDIGNELAQALEIERERRARAAQALSALSLQYQILSQQNAAINALQRPTNTTCQSFGSITNCNTY